MATGSEKWEAAAGRWVEGNLACPEEVIGKLEDMSQKLRYGHSMHT